MRNILLFIFSIIIFSVILTLNRPSKHFCTYQEVLKEMIEQAPLKTYRNQFYGYQIHYPELFTCETDTQTENKGFVRFSYHQTERFVIECEVLQDQDITPVKVKMKETADLLHAEHQTALRDSFILSGKLYENNLPVEGYHFHCKYVRRQKLWFRYAFYYPASCQDSVQRIISNINLWNIQTETQRLLPLTT